MKRILLLLLFSLISFSFSDGFPSCPLSYKTVVLIDETSEVERLSGSSSEYTSEQIDSYAPATDWDVLSFGNDYPSDIVYEGYKYDRGHSVLLFHNSDIPIYAILSTWYHKKIACYNQCSSPDLEYSEQANECHAPCPQGTTWGQDDNGSWSCIMTPDNNDYCPLNPSDPCAVVDCVCPPGSSEDATMTLCYDSSTGRSFAGMNCTSNPPQCPPIDGSLPLVASNISQENCNLYATANGSLYNVTFHSQDNPPLTCCYSDNSNPFMDDNSTDPDDNSTDPDDNSTDPDSDGDGIPDSLDDDDDGDGIPDSQECDNGGCARLTTLESSTGICIQDLNSNCIPDVEEVDSGGDDGDSGDDQNGTDGDDGDSGDDQNGTGGDDQNGTDGDDGDSGDDQNGTGGDDQNGTDGDTLPNPEDFPSTDGNNTAFEEFGTGFGDIVDGFLIEDILPAQSGGSLHTISVTLNGKTYILFNPSNIPPSTWTTMQSVLKFIAIIAAIFTIFSSI